MFIGQRYQVLSLLGAGGMGGVYRARDRLTAQEVALKQVRLQPLPSPSGRAQSHSRGSSSTARRTFRLALAHEFRTLATLRHPNIVDVLDYGFDAEREPFFTMQLLAEPRDLLSATRSAELPEKLSILAQLLRALVYLHRHNIIHRDIKPSGIALAKARRGCAKGSAARTGDGHPADGRRPKWNASAARLAHVGFVDYLSIDRMWKLISDEPGPNAMPPSGQPGSVKCREHGLSLMQELRRATAAEHAAAERELGLMRPEVCLADYRAYLLRMWSVHAAIEDRLDGVAGLRELLPDLDERRRCAALACDLRALGLPDEELSRRKRTDFLSPQPTCAELLGALYVVEGSTLGGRIIARHLDQVLSTAIQHARSYLDAYADLSGMWKRFGAAADSFGRAHPERLPQVIAAARASFRALLS